MTQNKYRLIYLMPQKLIDNLRSINPYDPLVLIYDSYKELMEHVLRFITEEPHEKPETIDRLTRFFVGLTAALNKDTVMSRTYRRWFPLIQFLISSTGARLGRINEKIITGILRKYKEVCGIDTIFDPGATLERIFEKLGIHIKSRKQIDVAFIQQNTLKILEIRASSLTGGKTGEESLLDKLRLLLKWLGSEEFVQGLKDLRGIEYIIAILFNEKGEFANPKIHSDVNSRLKDITEYLIEHIHGQIKDLVEKKGWHIRYPTSMDEKALRSAIQQNNFRGRIRLRHSSTGLEFQIGFSYGDVLGEDLGLGAETFKKEIENIENMAVDDYWLTFSIVMHEIEIYNQFGVSNAKIVYELIHQDLENTLSNVVSSSSVQITTDIYGVIESLWDQLNKAVDDLIFKVLKEARSRNISLQLLETNDMVKQCEYLKQLIFMLLIYEKALHTHRLAKPLI